MTAKTVVPNGIRGDTGQPGLPPMTPEELAQHVLSAAGVAPKGQEELKKSVQRDIPKKLAAIAQFLAASAVNPPATDETSQDKWLSDLARTLAVQFQVPGADQPETIESIADRLKRDTLTKLTDILGFLAQGDADKLAAYLLQDQDEAPDNSPTLKEQLKRSALAGLAAVRKDWLTPERAAQLEANPASRQEWLHALITTLQLVPVAALNTSAAANVSPLAPLTTVLGTLPHGPATPSPWLDPLLQKLADRLGKASWKKSASWNLLLSLLDEALALRAAEPLPAISWASLFEALRKWVERLGQSLADLGVKEGVDATDPKQAGWGIIFPAEGEKGTRFKKIEERLDPLLKRRQDQAGLFRVFKGGEGYRPRDTASTWLSRLPRKARPADPADPAKTGVPYYLLLVGSPEEIPFHFQYQLDVQYAVGRIDFGDDLDAYGHYAANVVAYESQAAPPAPAGTVSFFGTADPGDEMTQNMSKYLVGPLCARIQDFALTGPGSGWHVDRVLPEDASRDRLAKLLGGTDKPDLLFAACHGVEFPKDDVRQPSLQGALLCKGWKEHLPASGAIPREYYLAGEDLAPGADLRGLVAFFFACFGAGTPRFDEYYQQEFRESGKVIASQAFIAGLPKAILGRPNGALAVVGHVERAWAISFMDAADNPQIAVFESTLQRLLKGQPLGLAMEYFNERYAAVSTELTSVLQLGAMGLKPDPYTVAELWTANNDSRGFIVLGDPAVRLR